jgi:hypothetical protein
MSRKKRKFLKTTEQKSEKAEAKSSAPNPFELRGMMHALLLCTRCILFYLRDSGPAPDTVLVVDCLGAFTRPLFVTDDWIARRCAVNRKKHDVIGQKVRGERGHVVKSRTIATERRRRTLLPQVSVAHLPRSVFVVVVVFVISVASGWCYHGEGSCKENAYVAAATKGQGQHVCGPAVRRE